MQRNALLFAILFAVAALPLGAAAAADKPAETQTGAPGQPGGGARRRGPLFC